LSDIPTKLKSLSSRNSKVDLYWINQLNDLDNEVARKLILELTPNNSLGFHPHSKIVKEGTLVSVQKPVQEIH
jgi:hypothetical protein